MATLSDFTETIEAARGGDQSAIDVLFRTYYPTVERMAHRALLAESPYRRQGLVSLFSTSDVVQETCSSVLRDLRRFEGNSEASFVAFLTAVVHNRLHDMLRFHRAARRDRRRIEATVSDPAGDTPREDPASSIQVEEEAHIFLSILGRLPDRERRLLTARLEDRVAFGDLAEELGYPTADAATKAFHRAQARLLLQMRRAGVRGPRSREGGAR